MTELDHATLERFVARASERLTGDWVVFGGAVLPLLGIDLRVTLDIDVACLGTADQGQVVKLMEIAVELGLPVEAINQAGAFFLRDIAAWRDDLDVVARGSSATIHVPNATLYVLTKLERLSESDLADCVAILGRAVRCGAPIDRARLAGAVEAAFAPSASAARSARLRALRDVIDRS